MPSENTVKQHKFEYVELVHFKRKKINSKYLSQCLKSTAVIIRLSVLRFFYCCASRSAKQIPEPGTDLGQFCWPRLSSDLPSGLLSVTAEDSPTDGW